ncbi:kinase [Ciceribacter sp. RN22]|uniref:GHMP family kinase ATP-binding protein n=1 Tax=Ciceribacter sp. RN22 TaxID=2954932 RepID=UPI0020934C8D|nr:kinase [Ciceribacter sp. RN22]MCO6180832.1 kinase [Ciceribacter sp. RN22]
MPFESRFPFDRRRLPDHGVPFPLRVGVGRATGHHGELLQGVFADERGRLHRGLLTLPCPRAESIVTFWPEAATGIRTRPQGREKAARAAALAFQELGYEDVGGSLTIETAIPVGYGYGSSTADVVAAIRAASAAAGAELHRSAICRLAVAAETASDALVFGEQAVLFAHREGRVLEYLPGEYPPLYVVGFVSPKDAAVDTLGSAPAHYDSSDIESFRVLRGLARHAIAKQDAGLLGHVASASARINQHHLPKRQFEDLVGLSKAVGACGIQVAHSGNLMGVLFDATEADARARAADTMAGARDCGFTDILRFSVNVDGTPLWG